ncbi:MAG: hypothetical protein H0U10_17305, partial [Chloroflexia bacterium]|nr:hypothetical protein [Chloroflexia bacterium]
MDRRVTALATLVLGAALALPGAHGVAAQDDQNPTGPTQLGGLGTITTDIIAGIASDVAAGTDGNVAGASLGNSGTAGLDGTEASVAGPAGSVPAPAPAPAPA